MSDKKYLANILIYGNKCIVKKCEKYLSSGTYVFDKDYSKIIKENTDKDDIKTFTDTYISGEKNCVKKLLYKIILKKKTELKNDNNKYCGEMILVTTKRDIFKVFDFENSKVITIFSNNADFEKVTGNRKKIEDYYRLPKIYEENSSEKIIIEELVSSDMSDSQTKFFNILKEYIEGNFEKMDNSTILLKKSNDIDRFEFIYKIKKDLLTENMFYKNIICHGDMWSSNIISNSKGVYYLDYEMVGEYTFFYDILFFIFSEGYINKDYKLIKSYLNGDFDELFEKLFEKYDCEFKKQEKDKYLMYFLYEYMVKKWDKLPKKDIDRNIIRLKKMLDECKIKYE